MSIDDWVDNYLSEEGASCQAFDKWRSDPNNQEIAESIVWGWKELMHSFESEFPGCDLRDMMSIDEVEYEFYIKKKP